MSDSQSEPSRDGLTLDVKRGLYAIIYNDDNGATAREVEAARAWLKSHGIEPA